MTPEEILELLEDGLSESAKLLVARVKEGKATATDINMLYRLFKDAGGALSMGSTRTPIGDDVLESMKDIDRDLFN